MCLRSRVVLSSARYVSCEVESGSPSRVGLRASVVAVGEGPSGRPDNDPLDFSGHLGTRRIAARLTSSVRCVRFGDAAILHSKSGLVGDDSTNGGHNRSARSNVRGPERLLCVSGR